MDTEVRSWNYKKRGESWQTRNVLSVLSRIMLYLATTVVVPLHQDLELKAVPSLHVLVLLASVVL